MPGRYKTLGSPPYLRTLTALATYNPPSLADGAIAATTIAVAGAVVGDVAYASHDKILTNNFQISAHVQSPDTVRVVFRNVSGATVDIVSGFLRVIVWKTI